MALVASWFGPTKPLWRPASEPSANTPMPFPIFVSTINDPWWAPGRHLSNPDPTHPDDGRKEEMAYVLFILILLFIAILGFYLLH